MPSYKLIVAKYKEDISWTQFFDIDNIVIYDKSDNPVVNSIQRPNIGRESETFLHYILENYDNLFDFTIFVQGNPFGHMDEIVTAELFPKFIDLFLQFDLFKTTPLFIYKLYETLDAWPGMKTREYYEYFFEGDIPLQVVFAPGCQYIVPRKVILERPKKFYEMLYNMLINGSKYRHDDAHYKDIPFSRTEINVYVMERLMYHFLSDIPLQNFNYIES